MAVLTLEGDASGVNEVQIAGRKIGPGSPCFIVAEAGVNHNGDLQLAKRLVDVASEAGADAVKFQSFKADRVVSATAPKAEYQLKSTDSMESQLDMLRRLELSPEAHGQLQAYCQQRAMLFMSTPFDEASVDLLDDLGVPVFKIASGEVANWPLLKHIASKGKPIILSTGMTYLSEVDEAVRVIRQAGCDQLVLLHCVSNYPASPGDVNLRAMHTMAMAFQVPVGYSDHTAGVEVPLAAVALGACVIEKHFTLDRSFPGPDHLASLEPMQLHSMVAGIKTVELALGVGTKEPAESEANTREVARRSIYLREPVSAGTALTEDHLIDLRPAGGIPPNETHLVLGRKVRSALPAGTALSWEHLR